MKRQKLTTCNMMFFMLDLRFKNSHLIFFWIGYKEGVNVVEEYDKQSLYHMLSKCFYHLHSMAKSKIGCVKQVVDEDSNLDFFNRLSTQMIQQIFLI